VLLGGGAWLAGIGAVVLVVIAVGAGARPENGLVALLAFAVMLAGAGAACIGAGQALAALRTRGQHMILATAGLILGALYLGVLIGWFSFGVWAT
jgi:hypothetical protein